MKNEFNIGLAEAYALAATIVGLLIAVVYLEIKSSQLESDMAMLVNKNYAEMQRLECFCSGGECDFYYDLKGHR